ncbi:hypothetical protein GCM10010381_16750 [Streptomyces xantholiticus]|nr:hypothetical protein GCM10010381_16750 [Streptomyces xantholiticus]
MFRASALNTAPRSAGRTPPRTPVTASSRGVFGDSRPGPGMRSVGRTGHRPGTVLRSAGSTGPEPRTPLREQHQAPPWLRTAVRAVSSNDVRASITTCGLEAAGG